MLWHLVGLAGIKKLNRRILIPTLLGVGNCGAKCSYDVQIRILCILTSGYCRLAASNKIYVPELELGKNLTIKEYTLEHATLLYKKFWL